MLHFWHITARTSGSSWGGFEMVNTFDSLSLQTVMPYKVSIKKSITDSQHDLRSNKSCLTNLLGFITKVYI